GADGMRWHHPGAHLQRVLRLTPEPPGRGFIVHNEPMGLLAALQFLTRVPIRLRAEPSLTKTVAWFPAAGAVIGATVGGVAAGMWQLTPSLVAA
ncbi:MAG TPA: hypothetical protein DCQ52_04110, partial [Acidimicrobiaceae bacterium]|nr:hypothetical protein [Acidimicrobiaceae bacterium]